MDQDPQILFDINQEYNTEINDDEVLTNIERLLNEFSSRDVQEDSLGLSQITTNQTPNAFQFESNQTQNVFSFSNLSQVQPNILDFQFDSLGLSQITKDQYPNELNQLEMDLLSLPQFQFNPKQNVFPFSNLPQAQIQTNLIQNEFNPQPIEKVSIESEVNLESFPETPESFDSGYDSLLATPKKRGRPKGSKTKTRETVKIGSCIVVRGSEEHRKLLEKSRGYVRKHRFKRIHKAKNKEAVECNTCNRYFKGIKNHQAKCLNINKRVICDICKCNNINKFGLKNHKKTCERFNVNY